MGSNSLQGLEHAALEPAGRDIAALGPGDDSDSGSDRVGLESAATDDPVERHPAERGVDASGSGARDIGVDRIITPMAARTGNVADFEDEDADLSFMDRAISDDAADGAPDADGDDEDGTGLGDEGDNVPGAHGTRRKPMPGGNPAPDGPEQPGLPGGNDDGDAPAHDSPDPEAPGPEHAASR